MKRILILLQEYERAKRHRYLIDALAEVWRSQGLHVAFTYGVRERPEADLLIPHIDLTRTPPEYAEYIRSFPAALNRNVTDLSKRRISAHLLGEDDECDGPVIVKTDRNYGGQPEYWLARRKHPVLAPIRRRAVPIAERVLGRPLAWRTMLHRYPIYGSLADVPRGAFTNPALVVERFLPEKEGDLYYMRHYLCLGDHSRSVRVAGSTPLLKRRACRPAGEGLPVPAEVLALRSRLGLDYEKIDFTIHGGRVAILDVSRTPGGPGTPEATARTVGDLADGIWSLLPK